MIKNKRSVSFRAEKKFGGVRHSKTFSTRAAASKWLTNLEKKLRTQHSGSNKKQKKMTVRHAFQKLVNVQKKKKRDPRTIESEEILNYFSTKLTNGRTEGFNRKAKLIQRCAYGVRSFKNYRLKLLYSCR